MRVSAFTPNQNFGRYASHRSCHSITKGPADSPPPILNSIAIQIIWQISL